jgi:hypothetical protein
METFHEFCVTQVRRLSGTVNFPKGDEAATVAVKELVYALENRVDSRGQRAFVGKLIDACLESSKFCPTVADLVTVAGEIRAEGRRREEAEAVARRPQEWQQTYGAPETFNWKQIDLQRVKQVRAREAQMYTDVRHYFAARKVENPGWAAMAVAAGELGYGDYAVAWEKAVVS